MFPTVSQLDGFTDVFGETIDEVADENFSQPLSLPTTSDTPESNGINSNEVETIRPAKHTGQHGEFRSVEEIHPKYRCLFTYPYFNLVQSRIIEDALYSDKSLVVCAPTGSGKTVVFELAILQLLMHMEDTHNNGDFKIIYMAPVKAVCNERLTEWYPKLTKLGLLCIEVTGDTEVDFSQLSPYRVIITTPEKWDMLTRRWRDHRGLVEMIKLFLIDEVHILNDETRGPVLEAVVSRMKTVESAAQSAHRIEQLQQQYQGAEPTCSVPPSIRFVAVSATVSNPEDVADWLRTDEKPAVFHRFGDECRPVKLKRIVEGYACAEGTSIFKFDLILNYKLWPIIQKYYDGKPTLIFCNTRKSVALTAEALSREVTVSFSPEQKAKLTALASTLKNKKLQMLAMSGVGCHHAGLLYEERINIERAFRNRDLPILITTTTLAMGVNLPAHLVIVKNTQQYVNGAYQEYSISTVLQMVGRAGRPQFDTEATAVIMTRLQDKPRYQALVGGSEPLQSYLHKRLAENLNSEAALGTVTDVAQCVEWLRSTFLYVRAAKDPKRYLGLPPGAPQQLILKKIEELCVKAMNSLASSGLITMDEACFIESTEAGRLMSLFYMDVETMKNIMKIEGSETLERLLYIVCESHELADMHLRVDERRCLNLLNRNNKAATIRFPMKGKISTRQMKLNCIIQATLGCLPIPEPALNQEAIKVMRTASRVCKCLVKCITRPELPPQPKTFSAVLNSIILSKCIEAHLWENSPYVSKQLKGIGPTFSTLLASAGVTSFMLLEESHPRDLERIMNKGPPAGNIIRKQVSLLPKYKLTVTPIDARSVTIQLMLLNHNHLSENMDQLTAGDSHKSYLIVGDSENYLLLLTQFTDKDFISVYDGTMKYEVTRKLQSEHKILIHCVSSVIVGIDVQADYLFLDLEPQAQRESDHALWSNSNTPRTNFASKQTAITDVYKERKRKNDSDITQCKEKKKREFTLTQKLKALKESFCKTSKTLKTDIDKTVEMSNKVIHDLLDGRNRPRIPENNQVITEVADEFPTVDLTKGIIDGSNNRPSFSENSLVVEYPTVDLTKNVVADQLEELTIDENYDYNDLQIDSIFNSIFNKIESEISANDPISNNMQYNNVSDTKVSKQPYVHFNARPMAEAQKVELKYRNMNNTQYLTNKCSRCARNFNKRKNLKSNFSVLDLIEKKANTADDNIEKNFDKSIDSGFSDAIKSQINKFLQRVQNTTKPKRPVIDELLDNSMAEKLPEVFVDGYRQENTTCSKSNNEIQCGEIKIQAKDMPQNVDKCTYEQPDVNDENYDFEENLDLPEVHFKTVQFIESNQYERKHDQTFDNRTVEYDKMDIYDNKQETNKPDDSNNFNAIYPPVPLNTNLKHKPISNQNLALASNITRDNSILGNPLQTTTINESKQKNSEKANVTPELTLELNQYAENQAHSIDYGANSANLVLIDQIRAIDASNDLRKNENLTRNINRPCDYYNVPSVGNKKSCPPDIKQVKQEKHENFNNQKETYFNRFSYTATKVDVCTKKYAPDHELRITRKLKLDVDVTEIMKQGNTNQTNEGYNGDTYKGHDGMKPKQDNENVCENVTVENMTNKNEQTNDDDVIVTNKRHVIVNENSNARKIIQESIEEKPKYSATNNGIGNILQKYSKILVKPETSTPSFNKINKKADTTSTKTIEHTISKPRKPFKITDINGVEMPLSIDITNTNKPVVSSQIEPVATAKRIKVETKENIELYKPEDINVIPETNFKNKTVDYNKSFESPVLAHSLKLDSIGDIKNENIFNPKQDMKDESMFNPKLLLQYCTESNEDTDIISPPAGFSDDPPVYSPIASQEITECYTFNDQMEDMEDNFNSAALESDLQSPKEMETWCLSKNDETYQSPMRSAPWVISQRAHTNLGARRDKLCQFKFVRKKPYRPK
ncbi:probable ATP-dependent DNA helicase HFM1 [Cydia strobilella]|uniref:probable ATP-dependent DNA helicase HFM1 n=1 Tax=Cydia strobilella TaxID=1100964 RepID=UPI0030051F51